MIKNLSGDSKEKKIDVTDPLQNKKLMGKDKKLKAQIKSVVFLKKKSEKHLKIQRYLENEHGGYTFF